MVTFKQPLLRQQIASPRKRRRRMREKMKEMNKTKGVMLRTRGTSCDSTHVVKSDQITPDPGVKVV
jgi:hypothetical protein